MCSAPPDSTPIPLAAVVTRNKNMLYFFSLPVFSFQGIIPWIDLGHFLACREDACCAWERVVSSPRGRLRPKRYRKADRILGLRNAPRATSQHSNPPRRWGTLGLLAPICAPPGRTRVLPGVSWIPPWAESGTGWATAMWSAASTSKSTSSRSRSITRTLRARERLPFFAAKSRRAEETRVRCLTYCISRAVPGSRVPVLLTRAGGWTRQPSPSACSCWTSEALGFPLR